jgi:phosphoglycolate phosphatase-like HAD superfamily hydrolase
MLEEEMRVGASEGKLVLPGVRELLDALAARDDVSMGLLTGNIAPAARIKLAYFGLWDYFAWGAFGDVHCDRNALFDLALEAARRHDGTKVERDRVFVIGDTPHDVACARGGGAVAIAVATGFSSADELRAAGADVVFDDLSDTASVMQRLFR